MCLWQTVHWTLDTDTPSLILTLLDSISSIFERSTWYKPRLLVNWLIFELISEILSLSSSSDNLFAKKDDKAKFKGNPSKFSDCLVISVISANKIDKFLRKHPDFDENLSSIKQLFYEDQSILRMERTKLYYLSNFDYYLDYSEVARIIDEYQVSEIGLFFDNNAWEYPLWVLSHSHAGEGEIEYRHIAVDDISRTLQQEGLLLPDLVLTTREFNQTIAGVEYEIILDTDNIDVWRKADWKGSDYPK